MTSFQGLSTVLGGKASGFNAPWAFPASLPPTNPRKASIGVMAGYYKAVVRENYDYKPLITDTSLTPSKTSRRTALTYTGAAHDRLLPACPTVHGLRWGRHRTGRCHLPLDGDHHRIAVPRRTSRRRTL
ncbi:MAG: hypothetical protein IPH85_12470 [Ignavibacteria bacterium]|nr:hypothetical protein [Ignavibacteria bacterium]